MVEKKQSRQSQILLPEGNFAGGVIINCQHHFVFSYPKMKLNQDDINHLLDKVKKLEKGEKLDLSADEDLANRIFR